MRDIGKNIRAARMRQGITQDTLAEKLFVTRQTVSNYETGRSRPDVEILMQIAEVLGVEMNALLYGVPVTPEKKREKRRVILLFCVLAILGIVILLLRPRLLYLARTYYFMLPWMWIRTFLLPTMCGILGWGALQAACVFLGAKLPRFKGKKVLHIVLVSFLGACIVLLLPWIVGCTYFLVRDTIAFLTDQPLGNVSVSVFPAWDKLAGRLYLFLYSFPYVTIPFGIAWKLTEKEK